MSPPDPIRAAAPGVGTTEGDEQSAVAGAGDEDHDTADVKSIVARLDALAANHEAQKVKLQLIARDVEHLNRCAHACASADKLVHLVVPEGFKICAPCYRRANGGRS